jgi:hypothetical protein
MLLPTLAEPERVARCIRRKDKMLATLAEETNARFSRRIIRQTNVPKPRKRETSGIQIIIPLLGNGISSRGKQACGSSTKWNCVVWCVV